jgi:sugar phosphate isomerase/epimerase
VKLGCSSWSYHAAFRDGRIDQREWVRLCAEELELDGVEFDDLHFPTIDPVYLRDLKKLCADLQLTIAGVGVSNDFGPQQQRALEVDKVRRWCDVAAYLGAPVVRVFAGWVPPMNGAGDTGRVVGLVRRIFGVPKPDTRRLWSDVMYTLRQCADYAAERGVVLAVQNSRTHGVVGDPLQIAQCVQDVGSPWLRICLDPADLADTAGIDLSLPRVVQVHARMRDVQADGADRNVHWPELMRVLQQGRYRGHVLLDYEGAETPESAVPRATRYLRGIQHLLQRQQVLAEAVVDDGAGAIEAAESIVAGARRSP